MSIYSHIFEKGLCKNPEGIAFSCGEERYTYKQVEQRVRELVLQFHEVGIKKNSKVIIRIKHPLSFSFTLLAKLMKTPGCIL